jgi:hypothetical protein
MKAFHFFLLALAGVTISVCALLAIAVGLGWDGMPWTILLLAALLMAMRAAKSFGPPPPASFQ